jgi:hypothetical protein
MDTPVTSIHWQPRYAGWATRAHFHRRWTRGVAGSERARELLRELANAPMLWSIVRNLTAIERVRPGHPAVDRDRVG